MKVVFKTWRSCGIHCERRARAYRRGRGGAPSGLQGKAPGQIRGWIPLKLVAF